MNSRYMNENGSMVPRDNGCWMLVTAHAAEVERLKAEAYAIKCDRDGCMASLEKIAAERDAAVLRGAYDEGFWDGHLRGNYDLRDKCWEESETKSSIDAALAAAPDKPKAALAPEPWGGPEGEEE